MVAYAALVNNVFARRGGLAKNSNGLASYRKTRAGLHH
jgi:hypothetical protein